jgi:hypothetical protein
MAAALSRVYAGICRRDRLTSKKCPFWFDSLFCVTDVLSRVSSRVKTRVSLWKNMLNSIYLKNTLIYKFSLQICYEDTRHYSLGFAQTIQFKSSFHRHTSSFPSLP